MSNREILEKAVSGKDINRKAAAWVRKAGGMDAVTEGIAARIVKLCKLKGESHEKK